MKQFRFVALLCATFLAVAAIAQIGTPSAGSSTRKAIMDGLRPRVEQLLGISVVFKVEQLGTWRDWAFVRAEPLQKNSKPIDYRKTRVRKEFIQGEGNYGTEVAGLLKRSGHSYRLVKFWSGYSDVAWWGIWSKYGLPAALFNAHP